MIEWKLRRGMAEIGAIHKRRRRFLAILDPPPPHIDPYRLLNAPPPTLMFLGFCVPLSDIRSNFVKTQTKQTGCQMKA